MLPALIIAAVVGALQRLVMHFGVRHRRIETAIATDVSVLIRDGEMSLGTIRAAALGRTQVFALLRIAGIQHLGQVSRAYMEPSGKLTIVRASERRPGLSVLPDFEVALRREAEVSTHRVCHCCGHTAYTDAQHAESCTSCGATRWVPAQLGELRRVCFEANGSFSVIPYQAARPGLSLMPDEDSAFAQSLRDDSCLACWQCGHVRCAVELQGKCRYYGKARWKPAVRRLIPFQ